MQRYFPIFQQKVWWSYTKESANNPITQLHIPSTNKSIISLLKQRHSHKDGNKVGETIFLTSRDRFAASSNVSPLQARSNFSQDPHFGESAFCCYFCDAYPVETGQEFRVHPSPAHLPPPQILRMPKCRRPVAWNAWMQFCCKLTPILFYFRQTMCINFQPRQAKHKKNMKWYGISFQRLATPDRKANRTRTFETQPRRSEQDQIQRYFSDGCAT
jgi:hypothetical protein